MKTIRFLTLSLLIMLIPTIGFSSASSIPTTHLNKLHPNVRTRVVRLISAKASLFSSFIYDDFTFNSSAGTNFNNYSGDTKFYTLGGGVLRFPRWRIELLGYHTDSSVTGNKQFGTFAATDQNDISTNNIFLLLNREFFNFLWVDFFTGYGVSNTEISDNATSGTLPGRRNADLRGDNFFFGFGAQILYPINEWLLGLFVNTYWLYFYQNGYSLTGDNIPPIEIFGLDTRLNYINETLFVQYHITRHFAPYIKANFLQRPSRSTSRSITPASPNIGSLPELILGDYGYSISGGTTVIVNKYLSFDINYERSYRSDEYRRNVYYIRIDILFR